LPDEILERINSFSRWHYQFELEGHLTPVAKPEHVNRHEQRKKYILDPLVSWYGGSLKGKRVLDLGCNAGFWSLAAIEAGCDYVLGIDGRQMHIDQANFVFETTGADKSRYDFRVANAINFDVGSDRYDIVLCLGLFYHINRHVELLTAISKANPDVLVIDTEIVAMSGAFFELYTESTSHPKKAIEHPLVYRPTAQGVILVVNSFGYRAIILKPCFDDYRGAKEYRINIRRAFICSKRADLNKFPAPTESIAELSQLHEASLMQCRNELNRLLNSRSWKITKPLRLMYDLLRDAMKST